MFGKNALDDFRPAWWCRGRHLQTMWRRVFGVTQPSYPQRERWHTDDGDFLDLDFCEPHSSLQKEPYIPTVLFLHGLEGSSRAKYILGMLQWTLQSGWRGVALNFRSCSGEINWQKRFYHSGETSDLEWVVGRLIDRFPKAPLFIVGFSLGGNVLLKWLGEKRASVPEQMRAATAISVPFHLGIAARLIDSGFNKIYARVFLRTLKEKAIAKERRFPGVLEASRISRIVSFAEFDNEVTAPLHGFKDAEDYWERSSAIKFLGDIQRPVLLISAQDDPFLPLPFIPFESIENSKWLTGCFPQSGGHVGFVEGNWPGKATYWAESKTFAYFSSFL